MRLVPASADRHRQLKRGGAWKARAVLLSLFAKKAEIPNSVPSVRLLPGPSKRFRRSRKALPGSNAGLERCLVGMLRVVAVVFVLILVGAPAEAQQGRNDYPTIVPRDWTLLPPKSNEWRAVSPRKDAWLSLYATPADGRAASRLRQWGISAGDRVTYQRRAEGWTVVSGYTADNRIFY